METVQWINFGIAVTFFLSECAKNLVVQGEDE